MTSTFLPALLSGFAFWLQLSLGLLALLLIHDVTGGRWGTASRTFMLRAFPTLLLLALIFCVIALGASDIYPWARASPSAFLSQPFFFVRGLLYFSVWLLIAWGFDRRRLTLRPTRAWSGGALVVLLFTVSFAAMDWLMTLTPDWSSTGFGVIFIAGALAAGFAALTLRMSFASSTQLLPDFGNLLLMSVMLWAYVDFMQYLIIWSGRIPKETAWYTARSEGIWPLTILLLVLSNFALPFLALLFRKLKHSPRAMRVIALVVLSGRFLESVIWVLPVTRRPLPEDALSSSGSLLAIGVIAWSAVGVLWLWVYGRSEPRRPEGALAHAPEVTS